MYQRILSPWNLSYSNKLEALLQLFLKVTNNYAFH
jgi:hypothetical protein